MGRDKRVLKRCAIGLFLLVAVLLIVNVIYGWSVGRRLELRLDTLRAAGEPTSFAELARPPIPPENDAAVFLDRASPDLQAFAKEQSDFLRTPVGEAFDRRKQPTPEYIAAISNILGHYPDLPHVLQQATTCDGYRSQIDFSVAYPQMMDELMQSAIDARTPARFLRWQITVLLAEGKQEEALEAGLAILRLARLYEGEPAMINHLVATAIGAVATEGINLALRAGPISTELRGQIDEELDRQDDPQRIVRVMKMERAINVSASNGLFWSGKRLAVDIVDFYDRLLPLLARPWYESQSQINVLATNNSDNSYSKISANMIELLLPALLTSYEAENRSVAMLRSLRIVNRLTAYAQENRQEASDLGDVDLPRSATLDPFSGEPLKLKWTDAGWVVYTVFKNGNNDNGDFRDMADWGLAPAGYPGPE